MPPPSPLAIATSSLNRLVKEEASYHREMQQQEDRIRKLEHETGEDDAEGNRDFTLKQERRALQETKDVFPSLRERITEAMGKVQNLLESEGSKVDHAGAEGAKAALEKGRAATVGGAEGL